MDHPRITFGDKVLIRSTDASDALGVAARTRTVCGSTTPSVSGVKVVGNPRGTLYAVRAYTQLLLIFVVATITSQELAPDFTGGATRSVDVGVA